MLDKPLILALSYFECDGICLTINKDLKNTLEAVDGLVPGPGLPGADVSFNKDDTRGEHRRCSPISLPSQNVSGKGWKVATFNRCR